MLKRGFDIVMAIILLIILALPAVIIALIVKIDSSGSVLYWSRRVGKNDAIFSMPKFRSMHLEAPLVSTQDLEDPKTWITSSGHVLRRYSLDEIPQLWSVLIGDMSLVGPRPLIIAETELLNQRTTHKIHSLRPGITGWAQVNGRDNIQQDRKIALDLEYLQKQSFWFDMYILYLTFMNVLLKRDIAH